MELKPSLYYCGVQDPHLEVFDIIMRTPYGTSYNAYVLKGEEKTALFETVKFPFFEEYANKVSAITPLEKADYLICSHTEPDHAGAITELLKRNPDITIVGTNSAIQFLSHIVNRPFNSLVVKQGDTLDLGGRVLSFHPMPNLHWPDTMFTVDEQSKALFCCDFFGAHYSYAPVTISSMADKSEYFAAQKDYFRIIMSPFTHPFCANGVKFAKSLQPSIICTGHGPVLDAEIEHTLDSYEEWCSPKDRAKPTIAIAFVSAYGYTRQLAETIFEELRAIGKLDVQLFEVSDANKTAVAEAILAADGFLLGTPTILGDALQPIYELTLDLHPVLLKGKAASAFGSYGWSGEGVPNIMGRLQQLKVRTQEGFKVRFQPSESELDDARGYARDFARLVLEKK